MSLDLEEIFQKHNREFLKFENITNPLHPTTDICAFLLLHKLVPSDRDMVSCAGHDEIWLRTDLDKLAEVATEEDILTLVRCGVRLDDNSLKMFV